MATEQLEADYLVVGAGAVGMAFVDTLIEDPEAEVVLVDRRSGPGGHWLDAYPFVRLHQPSANYGVSSTALGHDRVDEHGLNAGYRELAGAAEISAYFDGVLRHRLLPTGRVRFLPMTDHLGGGRLRSTVSGAETEVRVRRRIVDATYLASRIPATDRAPYEVAEGVRHVPVGELVHLTEPAAGYVVIGGGKTAMDAVTWLLGQGTPPDAITWVRPRDSWLLARDRFQPDDGALRTFEGTVHELEAVAESATVEEAYERLEHHDVMWRIDPTVVPTMVKGATVSHAELLELRRVTDVVRLGHVQRIDLDRIVLDEGTVPTSPDHVHVHCASPGLSLGPAKPVFTEDTITIQSLVRMHPTLAAALTGFVEASGRSTEQKNALLPANPYTDSPADFLRMVLQSLATELSWQGEDDLREWLAGSRLNVLRALPRTDDRDALRALQGRLFAGYGPAQANLGALLAGEAVGEAEVAGLVDADHGTAAGS